MRKTYRQRNGLSLWSTCFLSLILVTSTFLVNAEKNGSQDLDQLVMVASFESPVLTKIELDGVFYDQVVMPGCTSGGNTGEPCLPSTGMSILIPFERAVGAITVIPDGRVFLGSGNVIEPVGETVPLSQMSGESSRVPNATIYCSEQSFPGTLFDVIGVQYFRGYSILVLKLNPIEYIPATGELFFYRTLTIQIETIEDNYVNPLFRGVVQDQQEVQRKVVNPGVVSSYSPFSRLSSDDTFDLLLITKPELREDFDSLVDYHNARGIRTTTALLGVDIPESYDVRHTCEYIREYIREKYVDAGIEYVLIGGDNDVVPAQGLFLKAPVCYWDSVACDIYYACLDGPYNSDGDDWWGESTDGENGGDVDLMAEVYVGRACVGDSEEVHRFIQKTKSYGETRNRYLLNVTMVGEFLGSGDYGGDAMDQLINGCTEDNYTTVGIPSNQYTISKLYDRPGGYRWPVSELIGIINNGTHIINHLGHSDYWYSMRMFSPDVESLTNTQLCFIYSQGCTAGAFDALIHECIGEYFTVKTYAGAFAGIWNARWGWGIVGSIDGPSQRFHREFWDAVFGEHITVISQANQDSKEDNLYRINEDYGCMRCCYYQLNLLGDPTISFHSPKEIAIGDVEPKFLGRVNANIENVGIENVTDIEWTISIKGGFLRRVNVHSEGSIDFLVTSATTTIETEKIAFGLGRVNITITAQAPDVQRITKTIQGFILGPFLIISEGK